MNCIEADFEFLGKHFAYALHRCSELAEFEANKGIDEIDIMHAFVRYVRPGDLVIDGGANLGVFTLMLSRLVGEYGKVLAFEPDPSNYEMLIRNIELNAMGNVTVAPYALWENSSYIRFSSVQNGLSSAAFRVLNPDTQEIMVWARSLDDILSKSDRPRLMKLDCEGAEILILKGAKALLTQHAIDYVIAEFNFHILDIIKLTERQIREYMLSFGYNSFLLLSSGDPPVFIPQEKTLHVQMTDGSPPRCNVLFTPHDNIEQEWQSLI